MKTYPKECVHSKCKEIFFVESFKLPLPLICNKCQTLNNNKHE